MSGLADLVASALVGVARRPPSGAVLVGDHAIEGAAARSVLDAAGLHAVARRAGRRPDRLASDPAATTQAPDGEPDAPPAPPGAAQLLELVLGQSIGRPSAASLVEHWITCAARAGCRAPHRSLVALLDGSRPVSGAGTPDLVGVLGRRGRWLAAMNPAWSWAIEGAGHQQTGHGRSDHGQSGHEQSGHEQSGHGRSGHGQSGHGQSGHGQSGHGQSGHEQGDGASRWATADREERQQILLGVRRGDPATGRDLIRSTWDADSAIEREQHLRALRPTLEPGDEPLLSDALSDRSKKVRAAAVELLSALPESAWVAARVELLRSLIHVGGRRDQVTVELPSGDDDLGDPPPGASRRAHHLELLVSMAPLSLWTELTGREPGALVAEGAGPPEVVGGWIRAAVRSADRQWAAALLAQHHDPVLVPVLDEAEAEDLVKQALRSQSRTVLQLPFALGDGTTPWSQDLSAAVVDRLRREKHPATFAREHTAELGARLDPSVIAELQRWHDGLGDDHRYLALPLRAVIQHVSTRAAISDAFDQRSPDPSSADRPKREGHNR